ncbi:MAG: transcriptional regulator [Gordonia sp.]|nr:transcriptional regulator [Gordonia sp. (in: high G+C Gram-positive bacteria)]
MRLVVAVIRPFTVQAVKEELDTAGITGMTITETEGYGRQRGHTEVFQGADYIIDMVPKIRVEILVPDRDVDAVVQIIVDTARTDRIGDGKIWVMPVDSVQAVRTGIMDRDDPSSGAPAVTSPPTAAPDETR